DLGRLSVSPPIPQHVMGARIGARREAVSRELAALEREGFVAVTRRGVTLLDPHGLSALVRAGFEAHDRRRGAKQGGAA
ncbi:MAG TPA: helix-turn-helix domain-containing protein, partial [Acetobacteraceae bacterium]|nr:helix-turn-helix domain-containing protein [Acetobacteraceae bacterium]